jgi:hypothetical protein
MGFDLLGGIRRGFEDIGHAVEEAAKDVGQAIEHAVAEVASSNAVEQFSVAANEVWTEVTTRVGGRRDGNPPLPPEKGATYGHVKGQLFVRGQGEASDIDPSDIKQGRLGDCYFMSSLGAIARTNPELLRKMIHANDDGTYTVTFHQPRLPWEPGSGEFKPVSITVTAELPLIDGKPAFAGADDATRAGEQELWVGLVEKAYASFRGGYGIAGQGGYGGNAMETITGVPSRSQPADTLAFEDLARRFRAGEAVTASTLIDVKLGDLDFPDRSDEELALNDGTLAAAHVYFVTGLDEAKRTVTLQNPWGKDRPPVTLSYADFQRLFSEVASNPTR